MMGFWIFLVTRAATCFVRRMDCPGKISQMDGKVKMDSMPWVSLNVAFLVHLFIQRGRQKILNTVGKLLIPRVCRTWCVLGYTTESFVLELSNGIFCAWIIFRSRFIQTLHFFFSENINILQLISSKINFVTNFF